MINPRFRAGQASGGGDDDSLLFGQGVAVVAGAAAGIGVVLLLIVGAIIYVLKPKGKKIAPAGAPPTIAAA